MSDSLREAHDDILEFLDELAANGEPGKRKAQNPILLGNCGRFYAAKLRAAVSAPQADAEPDASERIHKLAVALVTSGWMVSNQAVERAIKEAEQRLLDFACDEIKRHMERLPPPSQSAEMRDVECPVTVEAEIFGPSAPADVTVIELAEFINKYTGPADEIGWKCARALLDAGPCYATVLATLKKAREALSRAGDGKESEGGAKAGAPVVSPEVEDTVSSLSQSVGALHPSDPTPPDRVPGLNWELSEETKKHLAEIDRAIVRPGDPRLDQLICGPQPNRPAQKSWPNGCRNPNSCSIHRDCMYVGCTNYDRDISGEVDAAIKRGGQ